MSNKLSSSQIKRQQRLAAIQKKAFWCADGTMLDSMRCGCKVVGFTPPERFIDRVIDDPNPWQIISIVFCESDGEQYYKSLHFEQHGKIKELQPEVNRLTDKLIADQNKAHFVSWAWWATPAGNIDLEKEEDSVVALFDSWGAWDRDLCDVQLAIRMNSDE